MELTQPGAQALSQTANYFHAVYQISKFLKNPGNNRAKAGTTVKAAMNEAAVPVAVTNAKDRAIDPPLSMRNRNGSAPAMLVPPVAAKAPIRILVMR
jgi:hypothetical protein